jgi:hypothetical protein
MYEDEDGDLVALKTTKNIKTVKFGAEHAEDVAIRSLRMALSEEELHGLPVILNLSKSPCSSKFGTSNKDPGCAEQLVDFVNTYGVRLTLICRGLYKGLEESRKAVEWMEQNGITVTGDVRSHSQQRFEV